MERMMTIAEIEREFQSEWVLVQDPVTDSALDVERGNVVCHSKNRDEVYQEAERLRPKRFAVLYTGKLGKNRAIVL